MKKRHKFYTCHFVGNLRLCSIFIRTPDLTVIFEKYSSSTAIPPPRHLQKCQGCWVQFYQWPNVSATRAWFNWDHFCPADRSSSSADLFSPAHPSILIALLIPMKADNLSVLRSPLRPSPQNPCGSEWDLLRSARHPNAGERQLVLFLSYV